MFAQGKDKKYESLMRAPGVVPRGGGKYRTPKFKYTYVDLDCKSCTHKNNCKAKKNKLDKCAYVLENIDDLLCDREFLSELENK